MLEDFQHKLFRWDVIILVLIATIIGSLLRWQLHNNFLSNIFGAAIIGFVMGLNLKPKVQLIFAIGFCSSLTTFSGWIWDVLELMRSGFFLKGVVMLCSTLMGGILILSLGFWIGKKMSYLFHP